ncbi:MAG: hypothetical protein ABI333_26425 [bacterium]
MQKVIGQALSADSKAQQYGLAATCNHGRDCVANQGVDANGDGVCDCQELGISDIDRDGFCDDQDYCQHVATGVNCDTDGDGRGDTMPRMLENCVAWDFPSVGEAKQQLLHDLCGGCDNCPSEHNPQSHTAQYPHGQFTRQWDRDNDRIGDACDEDRDGDGIHDDYDCDDLNPGIAHDRDGDGVCDPLTRDPFAEQLASIPCHLACDENDLWYFNYDYQACQARCSIKDNCFDLDSAFCHTIDQCTTMAAAATQAACESSGHCEFVPGPRWPDDSRGNRCVPKQTHHCAVVHGNPAQTDSDGIPSYPGDGGDKCDYVPRVTDVHFGKGHQLSPFWCDTSQYTVGFKTLGGDVTLTATHVDSDGFYIPEFLPTTRDGVNVGACKCALALVNGEWHTNCEDSTRCPLLDEYVGYRRTWNPIDAPETHEGLLTGNPTYPTAGAMEPWLRTHVEDHSLIFGREVGFTRAGGGSYHAFTWMTDFAIDFVSSTSWGEVDWADPTDVAKVKVRVAWPPYSRINDPVAGEVLLSRPGPTSGDCGLATSLSGRELVELAPPDIDPGDVLPPEMIVSVIPGTLVEELGSPLRSKQLGRAGYFMGQDPVSGDLHLYALGSEVPKVVAIWKLEAAELAASTTEIIASSGPMDSGLVGQDGGRLPSVFVYQSPLAAPTEPGELPTFERASKLYIGVETKGEPLALESTDDLFGTPSPDVWNARVVYASKRQQVLLFGAAAPDLAPVHVWRLDLAKGSWEGPFRLDLPQTRTGFSLSYDWLTDRIFAFGGGVAGSYDTAAVYTIDPATLFVRRFAAISAPGTAGLARNQAGAYLDPVERALYVYGGKRGSTIIAEKDVWRLDLAARRWTLLPETSFDDAPEPLTSPFVYYDRRRRTVWVGDLLGASTADGLDLWALDKEGSWHATESFRAPAEVQWPVRDSFSPGKAQSFAWTTSAGTDWPGELLLAQLRTERPVLGVSAVSQSGDLLGISRETDSGLQEAAFLCPVGQRCYLQVSALPRGGDASWEPYTLSVVPAETVLVSQEILVPGNARDLEIKGDTIYVAGMGGVRTLHAGVTLDPLSSIGGFQGAAATGLELCGLHLCVSRLGPGGLKVIDISDPESMRVVGSALTVGLGWDLAVVGRTAYVAHGALGVGVYDLSDPGVPCWTDQLDPGGQIRTVAAREGLLAAGGMKGTIFLYDLSGGPTSVGQIQAKGQISRIKLVAGQLWLLDKNGDWAEIYDVRDPAAPVKVGELSKDAQLYFNGKLRGSHAYSFHGNRVDVYEIRPTP